MAGPGYKALQQLKDDMRGVEPGIVFKIDSIYFDEDDMESSRDSFYAAIKLINTDLPDDLRALLFEMDSKNQWRMTENKGYYLIKQDLNADGLNEYIFIQSQKHYQQLNMFFKDDGKWNAKKLQTTSHSNQFETDLFESILNQETAAITPDWHHLKIGDRIYQVQ